MFGDWVDGDVDWQRLLDHLDEALESQNTTVLDVFALHHLLVALQDVHVALFPRCESIPSWTKDTNVALEEGVHFEGVPQPVGVGLELFAAVATPGVRDVAFDVSP